MQRARSELSVRHSRKQTKHVQSGSRRTRRMAVASQPIFRDDRQTCSRLALVFSVTQVVLLTPGLHLLAIAEFAYRVGAVTALQYRGWGL